MTVRFDDVAMLAVCLGACLTMACGAETDPDPMNDTTPMETTDTTPVDPRDEFCVATEVEEDSFVVAGVGAMDGPPSFPPSLPPGAVVSSTYLRLKDTEEAQQRFDELNGPITAELTAPAEGLMGLSIRISLECNTARTITVWESEEALMKFVLGDAHINAVRATGELSRGGTITDVWEADTVENFEWATVVAGFANHDGPVF